MKSFAPCDFEKADYPVFLSIMAEKKDIRSDLYVLFSFFETLFSVPQKVREPILGMLRIRWWRDALLSGAQDPMLLVYVRDVSQRHGIPLETYVLLCDGFEKYLTEDLTPDQILQMIFKPFMATIFKVLGRPIRHKRYYTYLYTRYKLSLYGKGGLQRRAQKVFQGKAESPFLFMLKEIAPGQMKAKKPNLFWKVFLAYGKLCLKKS